MAQKSDLVHLSCDSQACGASERVTAIGGGMVPGLENVRFVFAQHGAYGDAAAQGLDTINARPFQGKKEQK